jgi:hypothetical protein
VRHIHVRHDATGNEWDCPATYLKTARTRGWIPTDQPEGHDDSGYSDLRVKDLRDEIDSRNQDRDESDQLLKTGSKAELVAVLIADDASRPPVGDS